MVHSTASVAHNNDIRNLYRARKQALVTYELRRRLYCDRRHCGCGRGPGLWGRCPAREWLVRCGKEVRA